MRASGLSLWLVSLHCLGTTALWPGKGLRELPSLGLDWLLGPGSGIHFQGFHELRDHCVDRGARFGKFEKEWRGGLQNSFSVATSCSVRALGEGIQGPFPNAPERLLSFRWNLTIGCWNHLRVKLFLQFFSHFSGVLGFMHPCFVDEEVGGHPLSNAGWTRWLERHVCSAARCCRV